MFFAGALEGILQMQEERTVSNDNTIPLDHHLYYNVRARTKP